MVHVLFRNKLLKIRLENIIQIMQHIWSRLFFLKQFFPSFISAVAQNFNQLLNASKLWHKQTRKNEKAKLNYGFDGGTQEEKLARSGSRRHNSVSG